MLVSIASQHARARSMLPGAGDAPASSEAVPTPSSRSSTPSASSTRRRRGSASVGSGSAPSTDRSGGYSRARRGSNLPKAALEQIRSIAQSHQQSDASGSSAARRRGSRLPTAALAKIAQIARQHSPRNAAASAPLVPSFALALDKIDEVAAEDTASEMSPSPTSEGATEGELAANPELRAKLRACFDAFDDNHSNTVSVTEIGRMAKALEVDLSHQEIQRMSARAAIDAQARALARGTPSLHTLRPPSSHRRGARPHSLPPHDSSAPSVAPSRPRGERSVPPTTALCTVLMFILMPLTPQPSAHVSQPRHSRVCVSRARTVADADVDGSGELDFDEFVRVLTRQAAAGHGSLAALVAKGANKLGWFGNILGFFGAAAATTATASPVPAPKNQSHAPGVPPTAPATQAGVAAGASSSPLPPSVSAERGVRGALDASAKSTRSSGRGWEALSAPTHRQPPTRSVSALRGSARLEVTEARYSTWMVRAANGRAADEVRDELDAGRGAYSQRLSTFMSEQRRRVATRRKEEREVAAVVEEMREAKLDEGVLMKDILAEIIDESQTAKKLWTAKGRARVKAEAAARQVRAEEVQRTRRRRAAQISAEARAQREHAAGTAHANKGAKEASVRARQNRVRALEKFSSEATRESRDFFQAQKDAAGREVRETLRGGEAQRSAQRVEQLGQHAQRVRQLHVQEGRSKHSIAELGATRMREAGECRKLKAANSERAWSRAEDESRRKRHVHDAVYGARYTSSGKRAEQVLRTEGPHSVRSPPALSDRAHGQDRASPSRNPGWSSERPSCTTAASAQSVRNTWSDFYLQPSKWADFWSTNGRLPTSPEEVEAWRAARLAGSKSSSTSQDAAATKRAGLTSDASHKPARAAPALPAAQQQTPSKPKPFVPPLDASALKPSPPPSERAFVRAEQPTVDASVSAAAADTNAELTC